MVSTQKSLLKVAAVKIRGKETPASTEARKVKARPSRENYLLFFVVMIVAIVHPTSGLTRGFYTMTSPMYRDSISASALTPPNLLTTHKVIHGIGESINILKECTFACMRLLGCKGFIHIPKAGICHLTSFNKCLAKETLLQPLPGRHTYELVAGSEDPKNHVTCLSQCLGETDCGKCGRFHCSGSSCQDCKYTCWELDPYVRGVQNVFFDLVNVVPITCEMEWQLIWNGASEWQTFLEDFPLKLRVEIWYTEQATPKTADYESITFASGQLRVGNYTGGTAGDGWGAPFSNRTVDSPDNSTCLPFFYPPGPCVANGLPDYESQLEALNGTATTIEKSYYWFSEDEVLNQTIVEKIYLYVTRQ